MRVSASHRGFSLVEVATSIGVIAFALVALLGVFPLGLENSRFAVGDTRATQILKTVSATLQGEPFTAADCFNNGGTKLDFTTLGTEAALSPAPDAVLYASYDVNSLPRLTRATQVPLDAIYRVEIRCRREKFTPISTGATAAVSRVAGTNVDLRVFGVREKKPFSESWIYLPNITRP